MNAMEMKTQISTCTHFPILKGTPVTKSGSAMDPVIYGNRIVWMDGRNGGSLDAGSWPVGNWDIYMYDLSTSTEYQITTNINVEKP